MGIESVDDWVVLLLCLNQKDRVWRRRLRGLNTRERERERIKYIYIYIYILQSCYSELLEISVYCS